MTSSGEGEALWFVIWEVIQVKSHWTPLCAIDAIPASQNISLWKSDLSLASRKVQFSYGLLPGFVAAAIFYSLTSFPKPSAFDRVMPQALIFTVVGQAITGMVFLLYDSNQSDCPVDQEPWIVLSGRGSACIGSYNFKQTFDSILVRVTKPFLSIEWFRIRATHCYVVLHLQRRLYGSGPGMPTFPEGKPPKQSLSKLKWWSF